MKLRTSILLIITLIISSVFAREMSSDSCRKVAENKLQNLGKSSEFSVAESHQIIEQDITLFNVFDLHPQGYIVASADDALPPVIAYSFTDSFYDIDGSSILLNMLQADIRLRQQNIGSLPDAMIAERKTEWDILLTGEIETYRPEQWPPEGSTPTGGWLEDTWNQSSPYNGFCPLDPVAGGRSIAGCPSIAMAQILNYHRTINSVYFDDEDDYYHNYAGRQYWIDDDYIQQDFLSFPQLNEYLDSLAYYYLYDLPVTGEDKAALVFACGVAARQIYTSQASGTFGVDQAFDAFHKFNFTDVQLIDSTTPDFYEHMAQNVMDALPVHLATVTPAWDSGHNFVVDGYNTDGYFHLNLGWGGTYNGWYLLPDEIPYGLTVIEGAVVDIVPAELPAGFISGNVILSPAVSDSIMITINIQNFSGEFSLELEPDISGIANYMTPVPIGSYSISATYPDYEYITYDNIIVEEYQITTIDFVLEQVLAPSELSGTLSGNDVSLYWTHASGRGLQYYNIYRNINGTAFTLLDTTVELSYLDVIILPQSLTYGYHITAVYAQENESHSSNNVYIEYNVPNTPDEINSLALTANYPNPFNPTTTIFFRLQHDTEVKLNIYNAKGQQVKTLAEGRFTKGDHSLIWSGEDEKQQIVSAGIYFYQIQAGAEIITRRMVLLK
jgi:Peptidase C10 family/Spi protease inhibitor/FlgD Ig-like domain